MIYGMPTLIENEDLEANAKLCKEVGFDFIELNMNFPQYQIGKYSCMKLITNVT